ncbi:hypothetical protein N665_0962s0004 [Sinapis alba]|nr:hypothetical protein N665_0962s0004 [Sinapis alba]
MEEDEKYDSCKEDISNDSQLQEKETQAKRVHTVFDTEEGSNYWRVVVNASGKYPRRLVECTPQTQASILQDVEIKNGHIVTNSFFLDIAEPGKWLSDENIASYVTGKSMGKKHKLELGRDVEMVSAQLLLGAQHWVGLCFNLHTSHVTILDSYIPHSETEQEVDSHMAPLLSSLPYILEQYGGYDIYHTKEGVRFYSWSRLEDIYHNQRSSLRCMLMVLARRR